MAEQVSSLKTGIKYKNTPIGKIPVDWEVKRLIDTARMRNIVLLVVHLVLI